MQRAGDAGAVVASELAQLAHDGLQDGRLDLVVAEHDLAIGIACRGGPAQVQHDLEQQRVVGLPSQRLPQRGGQHREQGVEVVGDGVRGRGRGRRRDVAGRGRVGGAGRGRDVEWFGVAHDAGPLAGLLGRVYWMAGQTVPSTDRSANCSRCVRWAMGRTLRSKWAASW